MSIGNTSRMVADATRPVCTRHSNTARAATSAAKTRCNKTSGSATCPKIRLGRAARPPGRFSKKEKWKGPEKAAASCSPRRFSGIAQEPRETDGKNNDPRRMMVVLGPGLLGGSVGARAGLPGDKRFRGNRSHLE